MRNLFSFFLLVVLSLLIVIACTKEEELSPELNDTTLENREANVWICHKPDGANPHSIWINENALEAHLAHGDVILDVDGDGFTAMNSCGEGSMDDCDDNDPSVNPGATEIPYDGIDNDCNPETPDEGVNEDVDQDGFPSSEDCDDTDASINPGAEEIPYDGIDNDCDPETLDDDLDEDGFINDEDCDDNDAAIYPGAEEVCDDEMDNDCDDLTDCDDPDCESDCELECTAEFFCDYLHYFDFDEPCSTQEYGDYGRGDSFCTRGLDYDGWKVEIWDDDMALNRECNGTDTDYDTGSLEVSKIFNYYTQTFEYRVAGTLALFNENGDYIGNAFPIFSILVDEETAMAHAQFLYELSVINGLFDICYGGPDF